MGKRGPAPKSTRLKLLDGNPGKRPLGTSQPAAPSTPPTCPTWLSPAAKAEWKRLQPELSAMGLLATIDRAALAVLCCIVANIVDAERLCAERGIYLQHANGIEYLAPWHTVLVKERQALLAWSREFGCTPASRNRVGTSGGEAAQDTILDFLNRRG